jgi:probable rRNA maturation factor
MDPDGHRGRQALRVVVGDERGRRVRQAAALAGWLTRIAPARARGTLSVALVSDARVRDLNRRYRGIDHTTDVLSFPAEARPRDPHDARRGRSRDSRALTLGDVVIARGVARRQAKEAGHSELTEWRVLALHGLLHLLGYDHEHDEGRMQRVEGRLRRRGGLPGGLIERAERT